METTTELMTIQNGNIAYSLGLYRVITRSLGIWPLTCHSFIPKCQVMLVCILQLTMIMSMIGEMHLNCGGVSDRIQSISLISCAFMTIVKVIIIRAHNSKMLDIILSAMEDWSWMKTIYDDEGMRDCAKLGRIICLIQMIASYVTAIPMILGGLAVRNEVNNTNSSESVLRHLPLGTVCFYGEMSAGVYTAVYILQTMQLLTTCTGNMGCDCYFFGITMHLSGQIEKLTLDMERFGSKSTDTECHEKLVSLVKRQNHLLKLAGNLEATFNVIILVELSALTYQICLIALQMVVNLRMGNSVVIINNIIMLQILYLQLFLYSYAGERLSSGVENLGSAIYNSQWCDLPLKIAKEIIFVMMRCRQSFALTAGKICVMNLESFKNIIKAVGSYFSVLLAMFDE